MNRAVFLYAGVLFAVVASYVGLVHLPQVQLWDLQPVTDDQGIDRPTQPGGDVLAGRRVYVDLGCIYCHSQQVRPPGFGADLDRGWGTRRSVARDYLWDRPHLLGTMRTGPDLANIGVRQPSDNWHYVHLYRPTLTSPGSTMPPHPFLFELRQVERERPHDAIDMPPGTLPEGYVLVPTTRARQLVAYLKSLDQSYPVPEAP
jgi:cytochrome c oxidase cbb3-type subunit II